MGSWSRPLMLAAALACLPSGAAYGQAFTQPAGKGRVITSIIYTTSDEVYDNSGDAVDIPDFDKTEIYFSGEYGLTDDLTLLLAPSLRIVSIDGGESSARLGYTDVGGRYRIHNEGNVVFSVQGRVRIPGHRQRSSLAQVGQTDVEVDLRGQLAATFGQGSFGVIEAGYRLRAGDPPDEFHVDATLGLRATDRVLFTVNSYNVISNGGGEGIFLNSHRYHNIFVGGAYDMSPSVTVQLGLTGTLGGRNALRERGVFGGLWIRF